MQVGPSRPGPIPFIESDKRGFMWTKQQQQLEEVPGFSPAPKTETNVKPFSTPSTLSPSSPAARSSARLGSSLQIKGQITGTEDLQIDGIVEGSISLRGHELTVGSTAQLKSEIDAREVVVYGKVIGNLRARERVDVKKDGSVVGDIATARITIEDGAQFKGRIEIDPSKSSAAAD
jgi:cytoskeletal protein CcmA (bactofilin family)